MRTKSRQTFQVKKLHEYSLRDLLMVVLPLALIVIAGFWLASLFIRPAPPDTLVISSGDNGTAYQKFTAAYIENLRHYDIKLIEKPSEGSVNNLERLRDSAQEVDAAFYQGGTGEVLEGDKLTSLGGFFYEPLWVFYRHKLVPDDADLTTLQQLKGKRISIGEVGSGTHQVAQSLLYANSISTTNTTLLEKSDTDLVGAFEKNEIDAAIIVGPTQSAAVWSLLFSDGVKLMSLAHADAYTRRMPYLAKVTLPRGTVDLTRDIPPHDITLLASVSTILVREDIHPALVDVLLQSAAEVHGGQGIFYKPGEFPKPIAIDFPLSKEAARYYKSGKPFLQHYLPFWAANLIDRLVVMLIPLFGLLVPIVKFAPAIYGWRVRSRIYRRYGELMFLEDEVEKEPSRHSGAEWLDRLDKIESDVNNIPTPLAFSGMLYTLRSHIGLVRKVILRRTNDSTRDATKTATKP